MIAVRGLGRGSFIWGSCVNFYLLYRIPANLSRSTNNTRIERLWVEVGSQFARAWRAFFYRLEALHGLDRANPHHLWLLHFLFLDTINEDCADFRAEWNCHPISGEGHDRSPEDMMLIGQVKDGMYVDDYEDVHPSVLQQYYGAHGAASRRLPGHTGAGQLPDEDVPTPPQNDEDSDPDSSDSEDELEAQIAEAHADNFHHEPVAVPKHAEPFNHDAMQVFHAALEEANTNAYIFPGYGLLPAEWEDGVYPSFEILKSGRRGGKQLRVALPDSIWRPRAELWGRALAILDNVKYMTE
ncbi:hypothetical protein FB45DRAFT_745214 [Roridomyces roridus]|uniref:Integrase core domain-containing protein n=1 Tax=Roridomyces roridus TaxID=1738132 RepID=A0AAD7BXR0_9AGAR|nr:hypothetical protein FB45DRAFT_745214 [Roridomyces roridus]